MHNLRRKMLLGFLAAIAATMIISSSVLAAPNLPQISGKTKGLEYQLIYVKETNEVILYAVNPTRRDVVVSSSKKDLGEFVVRQGNKVVWRAGFDGTGFFERFRPNEGRIYKKELLVLSAGTYYVEAYLYGESSSKPVAGYLLALMSPRSNLKYDIQYMGSSWFNQSPRLRLTIKNESGRDLSLPYQYGYQVLVKRPGDKDYLGNVGIGQSLGTIEKGASRYVFVSLDRLKPGLYQVDVRSNVEGGAYTVVDSTFFYIQ